MKYFTSNSTREYIDVLPDLVNRYNNTIHSSIKMTPVEASKKENEDAVMINLYGRIEKYKKPKFSVGDKVRMAKKRSTFAKGYTERWSDEVFTISEVIRTIPVTYKIKDLAGEDIDGTFYELKLQKTAQTSFEIEDIITENKKLNESLVQWKGDPPIYTWIDNTVIRNMMK